MILVLLGTQNNSFHRLLEEIQRLIDKKVIQEKVMVQAGKTKFISNDMEIFDLVEQTKLDELIKQANYIITHGGVGSILTCVKAGKKVIAVARKQQYGEHVNDHQIQIVESFDRAGYLKGITNVTELEKAIGELGDFKPKRFTSNTENMIKLIEEFIEKDSRKERKKEKEKKVKC